MARISDQIYGLKTKRYFYCISAISHLHASPCILYIVLYAYLYLNKVIKKENINNTV